MNNEYGELLMLLAKECKLSQLLTGVIFLGKNFSKVKTN